MKSKQALVPNLRFGGNKDEWKSTKLSDFFSIFNGYAFSSSDSTKVGCRWLKIADVGINKIENSNLSYLPADFPADHPRFVLKEGDYVVALTRPILRKKLKIAVVDGSADGSLLNQRVGKLVSTHSLQFVYCVLQRYALIARIDARIAGTDPPNLSPNEINTLATRIPTLPEQEKIAAFLTSVDDRIDQLKRKKSLLQDYKKGAMQKLFSQELRFKDEQGNPYPDWEEKKLGEVAPRVTQKNKVDERNVLTISAQQGLINQMNYFNHSVAAKDLSGYYLLQEGDFAYNKSYSKGYPMGAIKRLNKYSSGVVSSLYICFRPCCSINSDYLEQFFDSGQQNRDLHKVAQEGARNHGLLNMAVGDFFEIPIPVPHPEEQTKIANFLSSLDQKLEQIDTQITQTQSFKKGLLQQMFV